MKKNMRKNILAALCIVLMVGIVSIVPTDKAVSANVADLENNGLELDKTAKDNGDGTYTISLESYTTGSLSTVTKPQPIDFVFVLDISGSMLDPFGINNTKKINALVQASQNFLTQVESDANKFQINHRVAMTTFSGVSWPHDNRVLDGNQSTEMFDYQGRPTEVAQLAKNKLRDTYPAGNATEYAQLATALKELENRNLTGSTDVSVGFKLANSVYTQSDEINDNRKKVTIFFSDGEPTESRRYGIKGSKGLKDLGSSVYSVGIPTGNNVEPTSQHALYLDYMSSNYPNATGDASHEIGQKDPSGKYLLWANNADELSNIFTSIYEDVSKPSISLDETTKLKDIISPYFELTKQEDVKVYTSDYTGTVNGVETWGEKVAFNEAKVTIDSSMKKIDVDGFNYDKNMVATNSTNNTVTGKKLVVDIIVSKKPGFLGGENVPTNTSDAGIYTEEGMLEPFPQPSVNVNPDFQVDANDKSIYVGTAADMTQLFDTNKGVAGVQFKDNAGSEYTFDGKTNQFVNAKFTVVDKKTNKVLGEYQILAGTGELLFADDSLLKNITDDTELEIRATLSTVTNALTPSTSSENANVNVFKPTLTMKDSVTFYGEMYNLNSNVDTITWAANNAQAALPDEAQPNLTYGFTVDNTVIANPSQYVPSDTKEYNVQAFNGVLDITKHTTIKNDVQHDKGNFEVQVVKGELKIEKTIDDQYTEMKPLNSEQTFQFKIEVRDTEYGPITNTHYQSIQFSANEAVTSKSLVIKGLKKGYYNVSEVNAWSWRYNEQVGKRTDNYTGNGTNVGFSENSKVFIGDSNVANTNGKTYYGAQSDTKIAGSNQGSPASMLFVNNKNAKNVLGDVASAINKFIKK